MFDFGWAELLVIGSLALIVVGPKDLPRMLRTLGKYAGQARGMAREFQRSMEDAAREADISDMKELRETRDQLRGLAKKPFDYKPPAKSPAPRPAGKPAAAAAEPSASDASAAAAPESDKAENA